MQTAIQPQLHDTKVTCVCGAEYHIRSTKEQIKIEICGKCHPFYTGTQRTIDTGGRVERFRKRYGTAYNKQGDKKGAAPTDAADGANEAASAEQ